MFAGGEFLVARVDDGLPAAAAVVQHGFVDVAAGNADLFAVFHVGDGAAADRLLHGLLDVITVTSQEALTVHRALVLAVQTPVDDVAHECSSGLGPGGGAATDKSECDGDRRRGKTTAPMADYCDLRTRRYHSDSRRTCFSV
ncbi:hypothetical protein FQZ97_1059390 [compost metagenome]